MKTHRQLPQEEALKQQFAGLVAQLKKADKIHEFFQTLLTDTEYSMLARRLEILSRLEANQSYLTIQRELKVSSATIAAVAQLKQLPAVEGLLKQLKKTQKTSWF